jgi:hypothetical protein
MVVDRTQWLIEQASRHAAAAAALCATARQTRRLLAEQVRKSPARRGARLARGSSDAPAGPLHEPFRPRAGLSLLLVEIQERDYLSLLRAVEPGTRLANLLVAAVRHERRTRAGALQDAVYVMRGTRADGLTLRDLAQQHAPGVVPAIDKAVNGIAGGYRL